MVYGMDGGMNGVMKFISDFKHASKSELCCVEELLKDKSRSSEKSQWLRDESRILIGGLSKKETDISDFDISESKSISEILGNYLTLALKA